MTPRDPQRPSTDASGTTLAQKGNRAGRARSIGRSLDTITGLTGLTSEQIRSGLRADPPQTLAAQAAARGVSQDELIATIVADTQTRLDEAVTAGKITQAHADQRLAHLDGNVTELVTTQLAGQPPTADVPNATKVGGSR